MFGFGKKDDSSEAPVPVNKQMANAVTLTKGGSVNLTKTPLIKVTCSWTDPTKDYDLMALVHRKDGSTDVIWHKQLETADGAVLHMGDVGAQAGDKTETIEIRLNDTIDRIAPFAYSAIENGPGSFREYGVSVTIDNGQDQPVGIQATDASSDRARYTLCFGEIINGAQVNVTALELYSANNSENQPAYVDGKVKMDAGQRNNTK